MITHEIARFGLKLILQKPDKNGVEEMNKENTKMCIITWAKPYCKPNFSVP